jgi:ribonuclease-3
MMNDRLHRLEHSIQYQFQRPELLQLALTHRSVSGKTNNERLEFLGDSIVNLVVAELLFERFKFAKEGQLSRLRAELVSGESLAQVARDIGVGEYLQLGVGELKSGGFRRTSILADAMEAIIGAIYLDAGMEASQRCIKLWFEPRLANLTLEIPKDAKTRLQEYLQSRQMTLPVYEVVSVVGEAHDQYFEVICHVEGVGLPGEGEGSTRRKAEQMAAEDVLQKLQAAQ